MDAATPTLSALALAQAGVPGRLHQVSFALRPGILAGLVGPNGSGKSTLLQLAAGLLPTRGQVHWSGRRLSDIAIFERGRCAAWVPQEARFEFGFSVRAVVSQGRYAHGDDDRGIEEAMARLDLLGLADRPVNELSAGERQRVMLARALATEAPLQLWDEPLAALDPRHALETLALAEGIKRAGGTVLFSLHDLRMAHCLDLVVVLHAGKLRAAGPPGDVLTADLLRSVFGVESTLAPSLVLKLPQKIPTPRPDEGAGGD